MTPPVGHDLVHPDFLIIGAQKCGTSWLHHRLRSQPNCFLPCQKDSEFFSVVHPELGQAFESYLLQFESCGPGVRVGDASAGYFWTDSGTSWCVRPPGMHPDVAGQVRKLLGDDLDLLLCLRNPVDRAVSAFLHHISNGDLDPERNLLEVGQYIGTIDMGFYSLHLENWLRHFSRRQIFCVLLDDILDGPVQVVKSVLNFLGLEDLDDQHESYGDIVFPGLPRIYADDGVYIDVEGEAKLVVSADTLDTLKEMYRPDVVRLETLIDRPLLERWQL